MPPVWVLSVDLQTRTATFQSGMNDAARAATGAFGEIKSGAATMGKETATSMTEARHGVMLLGEEFGVHLPRGVTTFIASLGPVGSAMEAAFPFLAIAVGATILLEHLTKLQEAGKKLTLDQENFKTAAANAFGQLDEKILEAGIKADELRGDHLAALHKQLELIDHQSMSELVRSFDLVAKAADVVFANLKTSWFQFSAGSAGAKHSLEEFKSKYDQLLAQGKEGEASSLLSSTLRDNKQLLEDQKLVIAAQERIDSGKGPKFSQEEAGKFVQATNALKERGVDLDNRAVKSQEALVEALKAQAGVEERVTAIKKLQDNNARTTTGNTMADESFKSTMEQVNAEKRELEEKQRLWEENYRQAVDALQQSEREKIEATEKGSTARLAAIDAAIKEENTRGLQETNYYKELLTSRVETARQMADEQAKLTADAGKEEAEHTLKMGELQLAADKERMQRQHSAEQDSEKQQIADALAVENAEFKLKSDANAREIATLDSHAKDYQNHLKALQDKEKELTQAHENQITAIKDKAEEDRNRRILAAETRFEDSIVQGLTSVITRHQSFAKMMDSIGEQVATGMIQNAIKSMLADDMTKERDAAAAARKAFNAGMQFPFPVNIVMGPTLAAAAFAAVMAFDTGGIVPGVTRGDTVPAMLTPGESVLPRSLTEGLQRAASAGTLGPSGGDIHLHVHHSPTIHALDSTSMERVLHKNAAVLSKHLHSELRKLNR